MSRLVEMPNGEVVELPDNITPEGLANVKRQYPATAQTRAQRVAAGQPRKQPNAREQEVQRRANASDRIDSRTGRTNVQTLANKGLLASFTDEIAGAGSAITRGLYNAVTKGDINEIGNEYYTARDTQREIERRASERSPVAGTAAEITGAILTPVGTGAKLLQGGAKAAKALGASRAGETLAGAGARLERAGAVPQAVAAGTTQGALNATGNAENIGDVPYDALMGAGIGGVAGGVLGGATHLGARGVQTIMDAAPKNAERNAYSRIAQLLDSGKTTPRHVMYEIAETDARGGDAMVQDMLPSLRAQAGAISRKPSVSGSNELIERGATRIDERRAKFGDAVRRDADLPGGDDALARGDVLAATRKADGAANYAEGGVLDTPINPTPALQTFLREAPEPVQKAMRGAYDEMLLRDQNPANFVGEDGIFTHIPNLRTFDYVKRAFDTQIGQALRSGDKPLAQGLSFQLDKLKGVLADANPASAEYAAILKSQRDLFQQQNALDIGKSVLGRIGKDPRVLMRDLNALPDHAKDEARIGIIDALINADNKADPVAYYRSLTRNDNQRRVMEFAFGGKGNLGRFERWVNREVRSTRADVLTAPGRQSETARFAMAEGDTAENVGTVLQNAMRGFAFGGGIGAASGLVRSLQNMATGTSRFTQEEIAKILLSKGENLVKGTEAAKAYTKARDASNTRRARTMAKAGQQIYTDAVGGGN